MSIKIVKNMANVQNGSENKIFEKIDENKGIVKNDQSLSQGIIENVVQNTSHQNLLFC